MSRVSMHEMQHYLSTEPAWLLATGGRLWVTRDGDPNDHVLAAGERLPVRRGDRLLLGGWDAEGWATWQWEPRPEAAWRQALRRRLVGALAGAAARALRAGEAGFAALARRAADIACRAQGCIKAGDSMASAGTV
jgi:hypothetical protein